ncbi:hypothetical protein BHE74_00046532, partial [Ensete ventricosum]
VGRGSDDVVRSSPRTYQRFAGKFVGSSLIGYREFAGRMLGISREIAGRNRELAEGSSKGCREFTGSSSRDQLTVGQ